MKFDKIEFENFRRSIKAAVESVEKEYGVEVDFGNISYEQNKFTIKTTVFNGSAEENVKNNFFKYANLYGFEPEDLGKEFVFDKEKVKIVGFEPSRRKYPVVVEGEKGNKFLITIAGAKKALGK